MKTQVQLYVKNETFYTRFFGGGLWFINIFRKLPLDIKLDGAQAQRLTPKDEPYVFDLAPGQHYMEGTDPRARTKKMDKALTGAILGGTMMGAGGGSMLAGAMLGADATFSNVERTGMCAVDLKDGDVIKISCQATRKGTVIFKVVK